jgi:hypothetical protein
MKMSVLTAYFWLYPVPPSQIGLKWLQGKSLIGMANFIFLLDFIYLPKELPIIWDPFLIRPIVLFVAFSTIELIPILSAPFLTPEKNISHPRPSIARKTMITIIYVISPMAYWYLIVLFHLTIMYLWWEANATEIYLWVQAQL